LSSIIKTLTKSKLRA